MSVKKQETKNNSMKKLFLLIFIISFSIKGQDLTVSSGGSLIITKSDFISISGNFTNNGSVTLDSGSDEFSSILVGGSSTGAIKYHRYVNEAGSNEWDLIGAPVSNLSINSFANENNSTLAINKSTYAIGVYDNATDTWTNYTTSTAAGAGNFNIGQGYQMASISGAPMVFTGGIKTSDQTVPIQNNDAANSGTGRRWNLVANPFPSYLNGNNDADALNNFLTVNTSKLDDAYEAIYGYNANGTGYTIYNHIYNSNTAVYIAPGQAFFIAAANTNSDTVSFTKAMQTATGDDDFIKHKAIITNYEMVLKLYHESTELGATKFYFEQGLNLSLDPGYDAGAFNQAAPITSRLAEQDQGVGFAINAVAIDNMYNISIPIVINQPQDQTFKVVLANSNIPEDINVYLEDVQNNTITLLEERDFELSAQNELNEVGRFFVHLTTKTLSNKRTISNPFINVFKANEQNFITIEGLTSKVTETSVRLYNILGIEVRFKTLKNTTNTQKISTKYLAQGMYIVKVKSGRKVLTKKLIIE
jgi:hypothetical protein